MMSDLCSSHQSVTTQTVQHLCNCGFSISVLAGTKSPHQLRKFDRLLWQSFLKSKTRQGLKNSENQSDGAVRNERFISGMGDMRMRSTSGK